MALAIGAIGCGSTSSAVTHTVQVLTPAQEAAKTRAALAKRYLKIVAPYNKVGDAVGSGPLSSTNTAGRALINATEIFANHALRLGATGQVEADIRALVRASTKMIAAIENVDSAAYTNAVYEANGAANVVRADLGLPPPPH